MNMTFSFLNKDILCVEADLECNLEEGYYVFEYGNQTFRVRADEDFHFVKEGKEDVFEIFRSSHDKRCTYTLKKENLSFDIKILDLKVKKEDKKVTIKYNIESDVEDGVYNTKTVILDFK